MMVRRDEHGLTHWAHPPSPQMWRQGIKATGAFCDVQLNTYGDMVTVDQSGPTCLWCIVVYKRESR